MAGNACTVLSIHCARPSLVASGRPDAVDGFDAILASRLREAGYNPSGGGLLGDWLVSNAFTPIVPGALLKPSSSADPAAIALAPEWEKEVVLARAASEAGVERHALVGKRSAHSGAEEACFRLPLRAWDGSDSQMP